MKKILLAVTLFVGSITFTQAQRGEIIYTDFEPNYIAHYIVNTSNPDINLDLDHDGTYDCKFSAYDMGWGFWMAADFSTSSLQWSYRLPYEIFDPHEPCPIYGDTVQIGDTIANIEDCWYSQYYRFFYNNAGHLTDPSHWIGNQPDGHYYISVRRQTDEGYCYGWIDANLRIFLKQTGLYQIDVTVSRMAYCTIPNYPLRVGQIDFNTDDINETEASATLHPNPTTGLVTITGENLKAAEVFNTLGQNVATATGESETMQVDLSGLPVGVYFVNVTDGEGRKCVRKVVKE